MDKHCRGLRKADVAALLGLLFVAVAVGAPEVSRARELANRAACAANLNGIAKGMLVYASENSDILPCTQGISDRRYVLSDSPSMTKKGDPGACLWLLTQNGFLSPKVFVCKSDPFEGKGNAPPTQSAVPGTLVIPDGTQTEGSYSVNFPWGVGGNASRVWKDSIGSSVPMLSDMAPFNEQKASPRRDPTMKDAVEVVMDEKGQPATAPATAPGVAGAAAATGPAVEKAFTYNSPNHGFAGQNVAFGDAHAEWTKSPIIKRDDKSEDNIWTRTTKDGEQAIGAGDIGGALQEKGNFDTVMVPARASDGSVK